MDENRKILIVEDDKTIVHFMSRALQEADYTVLVAGTAAKAMSLFASAEPDIVLLDLGLPDMDGLELLKKLKSQQEAVPVLVVSAREREEDKVSALDLGADDYVTKPFGISELMARIRTALRHSGAVRSAGFAQQSEVFELNGLTMDVAQHLVLLDGEKIHFTQHEFQILELLLQHRGRVLTYAWIMRQVWGNYVPDDNQILRVNMANIRRKLHENPARPRFIHTELGVGYRLLEEPESEQASSAN